MGTTCYVWIGLFIRIPDVILPRFPKQVRLFCRFPLFSTYSTTTVFPVFFNPIGCRDLHPDTQPYIALQTLCSILLENSLTFRSWTTNTYTSSSYSREKLIEGLLNIWIFSAFFRFPNVPCYPSRNTLSFHSFSSSCITQTTIDFGLPVISVSQLWLMLGGWLLVCPSKQCCWLVLNFSVASWQESKILQIKSRCTVLNKRAFLAVC